MVVKSWPTAKLCVSIAITISMADAHDGERDAADQHQSGRADQVCGRRNRAASNRNSSTSMSTTIATAASRLPAISPNA